ncbi:MAG: hypothetical protein EOM05_09895, partial [Clostridia bacterium]|nr:hypothetical protein [Clostridia bacterium]
MTFQWVQSGTNNSNLTFEYDGLTHSIVAKVDVSSLAVKDRNYPTTPIIVESYEEVALDINNIPYTNSKILVGTYHAKILRITNETNYELVQNYTFENYSAITTKEWTITRRHLDVVWSFNTDGLSAGATEYNSSAQFYYVDNVQKTLESLNFSESLISLNYEEIDSNGNFIRTIQESERDQQIINVGYYKVTATAGGSYADYYDISSGTSSMQWQITKKAIAVVWIDNITSETVVN